MKNTNNFRRKGWLFLALTALAFWAPVAKAGVLLQDRYINPYTSEGLRMGAEKMDQQWTWIIGLVLVFLVAVIAMILVLQNRLNGFIEKESLKSIDPEVLKTKSTWRELFVKPERDKPLDAPIEGHNYDGIVELDNNPPAWFNWLFFLPIAWGFFYILYFHVLNVGPLQAGEYEQEVKLASGSMADIEAQRAAEIENLQPLTGAEELSNGARLFKLNCASCHKDDGSGGTGPNLTDNQWIHGGDFKSVFNTAYEGVLSKGMPSWKKLLKFEEVVQISSYIDQELRNTNVPGKAPEGEVYEGD